nr:hypothetical protein [Tanacetum cinerariifolium]
MANLSEDIQCPMRDRTDFASWQQRIRLYCRGKDNGVNILKSIDEGPYKLETFRETLAESTEGTPQFGPERPRVYSDLNSEERDRQHKEESINDYYVRFSKLINDMRNIKMTMPKLQLNSKFVNNMLPKWGRFVMAVKLNRELREFNYDQLFTYLKQHEAHAKENKMVLERLSQPIAQPTADPLALTFLPQTNNQLRTSSNPRNQATVQDDRVVVQNVQGRPNRDEAPTAQTMFMANLSSANLITDEAGPSYDLDILSEYVKDNEVPVVHSNASSVQNDTFMMIYNDMCEPSTPYVSNSSRNAVVKNSLTAELATYREQVELRRPLYNDQNKVAIGYKNPLCLTRAKQAQPALYNGHEILNDNHARAKVHNIEDTLEIAEITRKKMNAKMTDPECVTHKVKIAPHDYSKENLLATFTPQKQLSPEQIYWSNDLMKLKSKALKERTKVSRPIKAFTVYPSNTPATLVPIVLPTTRQVKIHIFTLIQLFLEFDKTCKKRITPSAITNGELGFKQTKACYLQEVIPFFQSIKDNFEGIQKALTKEVKQIKDVFEELEAEVAQCAVDRKHDAIDQKNLLIANDTLIAECLSKEVFSVATKSELNVARFAKMYFSNTSVEVRCLALEAELATLRDKSHQENQGELIKHFSKLELTKVTDPVTNLQAQNDRFRAENDKVKQHYKQLYDSIKITRAKHIEQVTKLTAKNVTLKTSVSNAKV